MSFFETLKTFRRDNDSRISKILRKLGQTRPLDLGYHFFVRILPHLKEILAETAQLATLRGYEDESSKHDFMPKYGAVNIQGTKITVFSSGGISGTISMFYDSGHAGPVMPIYELDNTEISFGLAKELLLFDKKKDQPKKNHARSPRKDLAFKMSCYKSWGQVQFTIGDPLLSEDGVPSEKVGLLSERFCIEAILERIYLATIEQAPLKIDHRDDSTSPIVGMKEVVPGFTAVIHNRLEQDYYDSLWINEGLSGGLIEISNRFVSMYLTVVPIVISE
jgi:hypothetical protein